MKIFFDTEFTGLHKNTTLISIGLITEDNKQFYAEFTDYNKSQVDNWIKENILDKLIIIINGKTVKNEVTLVKGNKQVIKEQLTDWFTSLKANKIEMWSDCLAYDWVLFNDIFGTAFDLPKMIYYIPFDICTLFKIKNVDPDINREEFCNTSNKNLKHNALYDAIVIKGCYEKLMLMD